MRIILASKSGVRKTILDKYKIDNEVILSLIKSGIKNISITNRTEEKCLFLKKKFNYLNVLSWK
jgi:predicted house-cleaning NTP pyrophosphatase (Maf/HAM1 superfamily)